MISGPVPWMSDRWWRCAQPAIEQAAKAEYAGTPPRMGPEDPAPQGRPTIVNDRGDGETRGGEGEGVDIVAQQASQRNCWPTERGQVHQGVGDAGVLRSCQRLRCLRNVPFWYSSKARRSSCSVLSRWAAPGHWLAMAGRDERTPGSPATVGSPPSRTDQHPAPIAESGRGQNGPRRRWHRQGSPRQRCVQVPPAGICTSGTRGRYYVAHRPAHAMDLPQMNRTAPPSSVTRGICWLRRDSAAPHFQRGGLGQGCHHPAGCPSPGGRCRAGVIHRTSRHGSRPGCPCCRRAPPAMAR